MQRKLFYGDRVSVDTCGGVLAWMRAGEIRSPGFPRAYPSGADCTWEVRAPPEFTLRLAVQALGLEERRHCDYDSLSVYDGTGAGRRLLGRFCGFKLPLPLHSSGNSLTLVLKSDASVEHEGFSAKLTLVKRPRPAVLESCAALREAGVLLSGRYTVDPDGSRGKAAPFEVFCDMTSDPASGVTEVGHDSEARMRVSPCEEAGCYRRDVRYDAKFHQIRALVAVSSDCEQHVKLHCRHIRFLGAGWGWWVSWDGRRMFHWGGAEPGSGKCACGMTDSCYAPGKPCNCDANDHIWRGDEGLLTSRAALPLRALHLGDTRDAPLEMAYHTIGKLRCRGRAGNDLTGTAAAILGENGVTQMPS
ncbi:contactin-associated protein 1-like isoform X1 [Lampetra planeri]